VCRCRCSIRLVSVERMVVRKRGDERAGEEGEAPVSSAGQQSSLGKPLTEWDGRIHTVSQRNEGRPFHQREEVSQRRTTMPSRQAGQRVLQRRKNAQHGRLGDLQDGAGLVVWQVFEEGWYLHTILQDPSSTGRFAWLLSIYEIQPMAGCHCFRRAKDGQDGAKR
jgi:hypothetical protein